MLRVDLLRICMHILGLVDSRRKLYLTIRLLIVALNMVYTAYISTFLFIQPNCFLEKMRQSHYVYDGFHVIYLYVWCCRNASLFRDYVAVPSFHTNRHMCVLFLISAKLLWETFPVVQSIGREADSVYWPILVLVGEFLCYAFLLRLQIIVIYLFLSTRMQQTARELRILETGSDRTAATTCHKGAKICAIIDNDLSGIVKIVHLEYFVRLLTEVPVIAASIFDIFEPYQFYLGLVNLYTFLLVVHGGETLHQAVRTLRKSVRAEPNVRHVAVYAFLGDTYGVHVAWGNILSWKSCGSFFGFCYTFSFMIYEYSARKYALYKNVCAG